ncbi:MAG: SGNH/GDSL hydrolase family protein [Phycisphaeraceae bacterium]
MRGRGFLIAVVTVAALSVGTASAGAVDRLVIFGDSLSDTGNADIRFFGTVPGSGYFDGRFSNGPVWVERLAEQLLLPSPQPNLAGPGRWDYAFGGAMTVGSGFQSLFINDVDEQVSDFLNNDGGPIAGDLTVVWAGANDFFEGQANAQVPVNNLTNDITRLYHAGTRRFLVLNLPMLGKTPRYVGTTNEAVFDARSTQFNDALDLAMDGLEATLSGVELVRVDVGGLISSVIADPSAYGFTNVTDPAMGLAGIDPDTYLF